MVSEIQYIQAPERTTVLATLNCWNLVGTCLRHCQAEFKFSGHRRTSSRADNMLRESSIRMAMIRRFIDAKQFQRLRNIKQLGTTDYAGWPNTSYSRFEHSLGVADLARRMVSHLKERQPRLQISDRDVDCVEIAGLCHDLGHGPWSHLWDGLFMPAALQSRRWTHEEGSEMMFDALIEDVPIPEKDQLFVKALIAGDHSRTPNEKQFLFDIVANKRNGFDVDKFDYIHRDNHLIGAPISFPLSCLIGSSRVIDEQICYNIKDANHIYDLANARFRLHKSVYNNSTSKAINHMIIDALLAAEPFMKIAHRVFNNVEYLTLTDDIMRQIESMTDPNLAEARAIFDHVHKRDYYECISTKIIEWPLRDTFKKEVTGPRIVEACRHLTTCGSKAIESLQSTDIIVDFSTIHYGMKEKNPMDFVRFYSTENLNTSLNAERELYSTKALPPYFAEVLMTVYSKKQEYSTLIESGCRAVLETVETIIESDI